MVEYMTIGQITRAYGINGEIKVYPLTDNIMRFEMLDELYIDESCKLIKYKIQRVKYDKNLVILKLEGIDDIERAESLKNSYIKIHRKDAISLPVDSFFICDIIGIKVYTIEGLYLGDIKDVIQTGSNDVFVIKNQKTEILIPALKSIFKKVDINERVMVVDLPEGLI